MTVRTMTGRILLATLFLSGFLLFALPVLAFDASDVLGQLDENGDPSFTQYNYNGSSINGEGFSQQIRGIVIDEVNHRLFVSDTSAYRILVFNLTVDNILEDRIADNVLGADDLFTAVATPSGPTLEKIVPYNLAFDPVNNLLFVCDIYHRVLVFDLSGGITDGMNPSYVLGKDNFTTQIPNPIIPSILTAPRGISYDGENERLFVSSLGDHRVLVYDLSGGITNGMDASYVLGQPDFTTDSSGITQSKMSAPVGVLFDTASDLLFVADSNNARILIYDLSGGITNGMNASYVLGQTNFTTGTSGRTQSKLNIPESVTYDADREYLFVGEYQNSRITVFDLSGGITNGMNASYVLGASDFTSQGSQDLTINSTNPTPVFFSPDSQYLYVGCSSDSSACSSRMLIFDTETISNGMEPIDLLGHFDHDTDEPIFTVGQNFLFNAQGKDSYAVVDDVEVDTENHRLFVYDAGNSRVLVYNLDSNNNLVDYIPDNVLGSDSFWPSTDGISASTFSGSSGIGGLVYDNENNYLFVSDGGYLRVLVFDLSGGVTNGMDASYVIGQEDFDSTNTGNDEDTFSGVYDIDYDRVQKRLFVSDGDNYRVLVFDLSSGITNGMDASYALGTEDLVSQGDLTGPDGLYPDTVEYDETRELLYVSDTQLYTRISVFDLSSGITTGMDASYVLGQVDFDSADVGIDQSHFGGGSYAIATDEEQGILFVDDRTNVRILAFDISGTITNGMDAMAVIGAPDFTTAGDGTTTQSTFGAGVNGLFIDHTNNRLYVADYLRVLIFDLSRITTTTLPSGETGTLYSQVITTEDSQGTETLTLESGTLPPGLALGSVTGTPTTAGTYTFTLRVTDDLGDAGELFDLQDYSMTITAGDEAEEEGSGDSSSSGTQFGCTDPNATNYKARFVKHKQELCRYTTSEAVKQSIETTVPNATCPFFSIYLKQGEKGDNVKKVQTFLSGLGFNPGPIDGIYGNQTNEAIKLFQTKYFDEILKPWNLTQPTGRLYQSTRHKMNELAGCDEGAITLDNGVVIK